MTTGTDQEYAQAIFLETATQYYVAGRFSAIHHLFPVSGNLLHHAVEMYLKGSLAKHYSLREMFNPFRHDLIKLWAEFKKKFTTSDLPEFDSVIENLNRFERIRYPDNLVLEGMSAQFARFRSGFVRSADGNSPTTPTYDLVMEEIDDLIKVIFQRSKLNPMACFEPLSDEARHFLSLHNTHSFPQASSPNTEAR
jgi:hypothetical protein